MKQEQFCIRNEHPEIVAEDLQEITEGNSNMVYRSGGSYLHVQIFPEQDEHTYELLGGFWHPQKANRIATIQNSAPTGEGIVVPRVTSHSDWTEDGSYINSWVDIGLDQNHHVRNYEFLDYDNYKDVIKWLGHFHSGDIEGQQGLKDYYRSRFLSFNEKLIPSEDITPGKQASQVARALILYGELFNSCVDENELTGRVHGDLRMGNTLSLIDEDGSSKVGIVDFEQSIYPGDRIKDLTKLLQMEYFFRPPETEYDYMYIPDLSPNQKLTLLADYAMQADARLAAQLPQWLKPDDINQRDADTLALLDQRQALVSLDIFLTVLTKTVLEIEEGLGDKDRVEFILDITDGLVSGVSND